MPPRLLMMPRRSALPALLLALAAAAALPWAGLCAAHAQAAPLPRIHNYAGVSPARAETLVAEAILSLGFPRGAADGPQPADRFFLGRRYLAWIDETGFYGKMNGLWRLDGAEGDALDFVLRTAGGRPVSMLAVAEAGDGRWPSGYSGAEHLEAPSRVPEPNDDPACATRDWCNQYSHNEAGSFARRGIPWWSACNAGSPSFLEHFAPVEVTDFGRGLRLVYEGPLVKEADGDGTHDGDACHAHWLFADGVRRPVYLRVGYELRADADWLDRIVQIRNPAGNPPFSAPMGLIGGFVVTAWPYAVHEKRLGDYLSPASRDVRDPTHQLVLRAGVFTRHPPAVGMRDEVLSWLGQPISVSAQDRAVAGQTLTLSHVGPIDNDDSAVCYCMVHGAIELGGGLIHAGITPPVPPGGLSPEARRRLAMPGDPPPTPR